MKKIFISIIAVAALAACSKETPIAQEQQAIAFTGPFVENTTKAIDNTYSNALGNLVSAFKVWGTVQGKHGGANPVYVFDGSDVKNTDGTTTVGYDAVWFCDNIQYWVPNANYSFTAVVDGELTGTNKNQIEYTVASQKDLLLATATASTDNDNTVTGLTNGLVAFTFDHLLSKAVFKFATSAAFATDQYTYEISDIQFDDAYVAGTYTVGGTWAPTTKDALSFGDAVTLAPSKTEAVEVTSQYARVFIPTTDKINVSFTITIKYAGEGISVKDYSFEVDTDFVKGHSYSFNVGITENNQIKFTIDDVNEWITTGNNVDLM